MGASKKTISPEDILIKNWYGFNRALSKMTEENLRRALELELSDARRPSYLMRIHSRMNTLRYEREKQELINKLGA